VNALDLTDRQRQLLAFSLTLATAKAARQVPFDEAWELIQLLSAPLAPAS
jgi:hypothetical protein